ncbi:tyrosine-type recombinase/integrase [Streptomyces sp. NBC_00842]|uniref:tyrosine-type recombinase/integrase n=1 Tax=Streptomyces sp. NBC_00842 TaxID=2975848 RepID=UPI00386A7BE6|nr:tyrosine-type recombinase/integrase [Streptomyces sp. NBC_00842]
MARSPPRERRDAPPRQRVTRRFVELCEEIGLPPVRLHDLRYGAATLAHVAGAGLKDIQEMLGHSSITVTADTYTSLLPEADLAIAEAAARLVPRARATSENTAPQAEAEPDDAEHPGLESVPDDADPVAEISEINSPSAHAPLTHRSRTAHAPLTHRSRTAHAPLTQTAPDEESEAE